MTNSINNIAAPLNAVRKPLLWATVNGTNVPNVVSASYTQTNNYHADRWSMDVALKPSLKPTANDWLNTDPPLYVEIMIGMVQQNGSISWQVLVSGNADETALDFEAGKITVRGRDLSATLIDVYADASYLNMTSSQVAAAIAAKNGLSASVTSTSTRVGILMEIDHKHFQSGQFSAQMKDWDLLTEIAKEDQYDCFVSGKTLHYQPKAIAGSSKPYTIFYGNASTNGALRSDVQNLRATRSLTLSKDLQVIVRSWDSKRSKAIEIKDPVNPVHAPTHTHIIERPNLTAEQAARLATSERATLSQHERRIEFSQFGTFDYDARTLLQLQTGLSATDQVYYIDHITHSISTEGGWTISVLAKNSSPDNDISD